MTLISDIEGIIESGIYTNSSPEGGPWVQKFEKKLTDHLGKPTVCVNSGTSALMASYVLCFISHFSSVCLPAYGFIATARSLLQLQPHTYFADVKEDGLIDINTIPKDMNCVVITDLYGEIADYPKINCPVIEDACQALHTIRKIRADYTCFSFYPTKIVGAMEGGAITFQTDEEAERARRLRTYPDGINIRMGEINACIGCHNFHKLKEPYEQPRPRYNYTLSPRGLCPVADKLAYG